MKLDWDDLILMWVGLLASAWVLITTDVLWVRLFMGGVLVCSATTLVASFRGSRWACVFGGLCYGLLAAFVVTSIWRGGLSAGKVIGVGAIVYCMWDFWQQWVDSKADSEAEDDDQTIVSLVGLVESLPFLDTTVLEKHVKSAWGLELSSEQSDETSFVVGDAPMFCVKCEHGMFIVHYFDEPYFEDPEEIAATVRNLRLSHAIKKHRAWFSVDLMNASGDSENLSDEFAVVGKLFAEIVDDECLGLLLPTHDKLIPWEPTFNQALRSGNPLSEIYPQLLPVVKVAADDPRMQAAVAEARDSFHQFETAFRNRKDDSVMFHVKAPITAGENTEFIWMAVTSIENDVIYGQLANDPVELGQLKEGGRVRTSVSQLNDWMYPTADDFQGGFTVRLLQEINTEPMPEADYEVGDKDIG